MVSAVMLAWDVPVSADEACAEGVVWRDLEGVFAVDIVVYGYMSRTLAVISIGRQHACAIADRLCLNLPRGRVRPGGILRNPVIQVTRRRGAIGHSGLTHFSHLPFTRILVVHHLPHHTSTMDAPSTGFDFSNHARNQFLGERLGSALPKGTPLPPSSPTP